MEKAIEKLCGVLGSDAVRLEEPMKAHTSFRIGGPAELFLTPETRHSLRKQSGYCGGTKFPFLSSATGATCWCGIKAFAGLWFSFPDACPRWKQTVRRYMQREAHCFQLRRQRLQKQG